MAEIGNLSVSIGVDLSELQRGLNTATGQVKKFSSDITSVVKTMAAVGAAAATAAAGVIAFTRSASNNARELTTFASLANTSTQELQRWAFATQTVQVEQDKLSDILKDVNLPIVTGKRC